MIKLKVFRSTVVLVASFMISLSLHAQSAIGGGGGGGGGSGTIELMSSLNSGGISGGSAIVQPVENITRLGGDMGGGAISYLSGPGGGIGGGFVHLHGPGGGGGGIGTTPAIAAYLIGEVYALVKHNGIIVEIDEISELSRLYIEGLEISYTIDSRGLILVNPDVYKEVLMGDGYLSIEGPAGTGGIGQN